MWEWVWCACEAAASEREGEARAWGKKHRSTLTRSITPILVQSTPEYHIFKVPRARWISDGLSINRSSEARGSGCKELDIGVGLVTLCLRGLGRLLGLGLLLCYYSRKRWEEVKRESILLLQQQWHQQ